MKEIAKNLLIGISLLLVLIQVKEHFNDPGEPYKIKTTTQKKVVNRKDSIVVVFDTIYQTKKIIVFDTISNKIIKDRIIPINDHEVTKEVFQTNDTIELSNAKVFSSIISEGRILQQDFKVTTADSIITHFIEKTSYINQSKLFLNVSPTIGFNGAFTGGEISIDYTIKNKIRIGAGVGALHDIQTTPYIKFSVGIPLN
ncbi:hypothetical protein [uncultured Tenacibaculum sp.]|uniref:hypothetical protein n=1 Tax=uncultured Tenacibaculum sp. TaxID=174713 RepID=UPI00260F65FE|nr:hypothetical protein [uncultured Tenacibaculum sp.]